MVDDSIKAVNSKKSIELVRGRLFHDFGIKIVDSLDSKHGGSVISMLGGHPDQIKLESLVKQLPVFHLLVLWAIEEEETMSDSLES